MMKQNCIRLIVACVVFACAATSFPAMPGSNDGFDPNANGAVRAVAVQPDGKILIGGNFENYNRSGRSYVARLNADGLVDASFNNSNYNSYIHALTVQPDGKVFVSGMPWNLQEELVMRLANPTAARQELSLSTDRNAVTWKLGGSFPWPYQVLFEESEDGKDWNLLGWGSVVGGDGYRLTELPYPIQRDHYVRATAWTACGQCNGSTSIYRSVLWAGAPAPAFSAAVDWMHYE